MQMSREPGECGPVNSPERINSEKLVSTDFIYYSDNNTESMSIGSLAAWAVQIRVKI
jgi:hypothetical protein